MSVGYGSDERYKVNGNVNFFNEDRRISVLAMSNNVNQQNFSQEDLAGVMSSNARGGRGGRSGGRGMGATAGGNKASDFMVGNLGGITATNGLGLNYVDQWGEKMKVTGSYFFNQSENETVQQTNRDYFDPLLSGMSYDEYKESKVENWNHRVNLKMDYQISRRTSLMFRPSLSFQDANSNGLMNGQNLLDASPEHETRTITTSENNAYNVGGELVFRHRFLKAGRTLSWSLNGKMSNTEGDAYTDYLSNYYDYVTSNVLKPYMMLSLTYTIR